MVGRIPEGRVRARGTGGGALVDGDQRVKASGVHPLACSRRRL